MWAYSLQRLLQAALLLLLASIVVFLLLRLIPGDPASAVAGPNARPEQLEIVRRDLGLDKPLPVQYGVWIGNVLQGDLGKSFISGFPVSTLIQNRLSATVELAAGGIVLSLLIGFPVGLMTALRRGSWLANAVTGYTALALAIPTFWLGLLLLLLFGLRLGWLPMSGHVSIFEDPLAGLERLILPSITLAVGLSAVLARMLGTALMEVMDNDYVRTARAKGLGGGVVIRRHVLKNALIPVVTVLGIQLGQLLGGAVITEAIFQWPGLGQLIVQAINNRDYSVVQGTMLFLVSVFVLINLLVDLSYGLLDPRIRFGR
ncbi:MAG: ABC transporter permease [Thermomicrobiales bacterium]